MKEPSKVNRAYGLQLDILWNYSLDTPKIQPANFFFGQ